MDELVHTDVAADGVAMVSLVDAPGENALSERMTRAIEGALAAVGRDGSVRAVVLRGLPDVFCSGASREVLAGLVHGRIAPSEILLPRALLDLPVPSVAAMEGHAVGGGLALGLCADIILLARESRYGASFMTLGFTPGMGMTRLFEHVLSPAVAHELLYTGELRRGRDLAGRGGINYVLPRAEVLAQAVTLARRIAEKPRPALVALKRVLSARRRQAFEEARGAEALMHDICFSRPEITALLEESLPAGAADTRREGPMTKDEILAVIKKYLVEAVDGLDPDTIEPGHSMKELGANSLDIVEVVSCTMRELKVKVPRSELSKLSNIAGLVDLLYETATQQEPPSSVG